MLISFFSRIRRGLAALFLMAVAALPLPALASSAQGFLGVNMLWDGGDAGKLESSFKRLSALGFKEARVDWEWRIVEGEKGKYDWHALDTLVSLAKKYNVNILPIVHYAPDWALVDESKPDGVYQLAPKPEFYQAYADFLKASIRRYGPGGNASVAFSPITYWQVWNEPNTREFWGPQPDPKAFTQLMETVSKTLAPERGKIHIVHAGLSKADFTFLWQTWDADPDYGKTFDILAVHPYFFNPQGGVRKPGDMDEGQQEYEALGFVGSPDDHGFLGKVFNLQLFLTLKGTPKPIWVTEIGFMAGTGQNPWTVSEEQETALVSDTLRYVNTRLTRQPFGEGLRKDLAANVQRVYWFTLDDYGFPSETGNFGLYRTDGSKRPFAGVLEDFLQGKMP